MKVVYLKIIFKDLSQNSSEKEGVKALDHAAIIRDLLRVYLYFQGSKY